ncbi:MAG: sodium:alanine symporter family protein [Gemmatimonadota bacterium]|nr:sodium:alanine symporter family protein [Gemmatimonadota bacterium]
MDWLQSLVDFLNTYVIEIGISIGGENIPLMVILLLGAGLYLTIRTGFIQLRRLGHGFAVTTGRYDDEDDPGDVSHFQALSTALSATVGIGNIAGVAIAIHWGGPGALFWMWVTAFVGMATKFSEVTLAQRYRDVDESGAVHKWDGVVAGGPMYYIERGLGPAWKPLAVFFAVMLGFTAFLTGNAVQANTVADTMESTFSVPVWITGFVTAGVVAAVILGGIRRIGRVTAVLMPFMAVIYVLGALTIIMLNLEQLGPAFGTIFREAFNPSAGVAGVGAGVFVVTLMWGVRRGLFSNEAGQGSAPIAHAAAKTEEPVSEGVVALLEPFIDTILICTMTALVIIMTDSHVERFPTEIILDGGDIIYTAEQENDRYMAVDPPEQIVIADGRHAVTGAGAPLVSWHEAAVEELYVDPEQTEPFQGVIFPDRGEAVAEDGTTYTSLYGNAVENGAPLTMNAFRTGLAPLGDWGHYVVLVAVLLFAVSTSIAWSYYGDRCARYLFGQGSVLPYKAIFVLMHFFGAVIPLAVVWSLGDVALAIVIVPNLLALILLAPKVVEESNSYFARKPWEALGEKRRRLDEERRGGRGGGA